MNKCHAHQDCRVAAANTLHAVVAHGRSLSQLLPELSTNVSEKDTGLYKELCHGGLRWYHRHEALLQLLLEKPLRNKDNDIRMLLHIGCYQLLETRIPNHAAINSVVEASKLMKKKWASGFINGVLRNLTRNKEALLGKLTNEQQLSHPQWFYEQLKQHWPQHYREILNANNQQAPLTLRVNKKLISRENYKTLLDDKNIEASFCPISDYGIQLKNAVNVTELPLFSEGLISVQDEAAQLAAQLLDLQAEQSILDACCAPGGKTCHALEIQPSILLTAIDSDATRLERVEENLERIGARAKIVAADACQITEWWDQKHFDRILLDAPCSASGVIRRHADIKLLRKSSDIATLCQTQMKLLNALWPLLKPNGKLIYATCSVLPDENENIIEAFLQRHTDAKEEVISESWGIPKKHGRQLLPITNGNDGFFYASICKH